MTIKIIAGAALTGLEATLNYTFHNQEYLKRAVTHSSLSDPGNNVRDLERLEFLGDRVLGLLAAEALLHRYPDMEEGKLAPRLNAMVRKETCAKAARSINLGTYLYLSQAEHQAGGRDKTTILGDACEGLFGGLFSDGGLPAARVLFDLFWRPNFDQLIRCHKDSKSALQEWSQEVGKGIPQYHEVARRGPPHDPEFVVHVQIEGASPVEGTGRSKRAAQMAAASAYLLREGIWTKDAVEL